MMDVISQGLGLLGAFFNISSFQLKKNNRLILFQFLGSSSFLFNYLLLGAFTGCFMNGAGVVRGLVFLQGEKLRKTPVLVLMNTALVVGTALTWEGLLSLLPLVGMIAMTTAMYLNDGKLIRIAQLFVSSPCWLIYNAVSGTIGGTICEVFIIVSTTISFIRYGINGFEK